MVSQTYSVGQSLSTRKVTLAFDHRAPSASVTQKVDWVFVRKYASSEPVTTVGEETNVGAKYVATNGSNTPPYDTWAKATTNIQTAINFAISGDTIIVGSSGNGHGDGAYTENVNVTKSLTIKSESGYATTTVHGKIISDHVFDVQANSVTIGGEGYGFSIYGATDNGMAGIYLSERTGCTIQGNRCGWESGRNNYLGIYLESSSNNTLTGNTCNSNSLGIYLFSSSSNNTLTGNTCNSNSSGIYLESSSNSNIFTGNTCNSNIWGIYLKSSSDNTLTGNTCNLASDGTGIYLDYSSNNTLTGNTCGENGSVGIYLYSSSSNNTLYLNNLSNNIYNAYVDGGSGNTWNSPTLIYYNYTSGSFHKNYLGNYYSDYIGSDEDGDGDGIGTPAYSKNGMTDNYPLMDTSACYSLQAWWLNSDSKMYKDDMTKAPGNVTVNSGGSHIWTADQAALMSIGFSSGEWTGQVVFTSAPASGAEFKVEIGSWNGSDFTVSGTNEYATLTGDGSKTVFTYTIDASAFTVTTGKYLALRITNNSSTGYDVQTGGAWSYCSSPLNSTDYSLPVELTSFTATPGNGIITLNWLTESEIENLGFNIYRSTSENGEFVMLNDKLIAGAGSSSEKHEYSYVDHDVKNGITYWYKLEDVDYNGKTELHGAISATALGPKEFCLHPNYPNPFNPVTTISYDLPKDVYVELSVYNLKGEKVTTLVKGNQPAGYYNVEWDGRNSQGRIVSSGMYFLRISAGSYSKTNKMVFVR